MMPAPSRYSVNTWTEMGMGLIRSAGLAEELRPGSPGYIVEAAGSHALFRSWAVEAECGNVGQQRLLL